jgi:hypothetical protein
VLFEKYGLTNESREMRVENRPGCTVSVKEKAWNGISQSEVEEELLTINVAKGRFRVSKILRLAYWEDTKKKGKHEVTKRLDFC